LAHGNSFICWREIAQSVLEPYLTFQATEVVEASNSGISGVSERPGGVCASWISFFHETNTIIFYKRRIRISI
jgi:hypothetical protein